jgi:hypothetical protein
VTDPDDRAKDPGGSDAGRERRFDPGVSGNLPDVAVSSVLPTGACTL